jgi:hypothetical protein
VEAVGETLTAKGPAALLRTDLGDVIVGKPAHRYGLPRREPVPMT